MNDWFLAAAIGVTFTGLMLAAHWWWGEFLLSPAARNHFFGVDNWDYYVRPGEWRYQFWNTVPDVAAFAPHLGIAVATAIVTSRIGLLIGKGAAKVRR